VTSVLDLRKSVEALIGAYSRTKTEPQLRAVWNALIGFWRAVGPAPMVQDEDGEGPDEGGAHYGICYRLMAALEHVGFDPNSEEGGDLLDAATDQVLTYLNEGNEDRDVICHGAAGRLADDSGYLTVDLVKAQVIFSSDPIVPTWVAPVRRTEKKVGRNEQCPCQSGEKFKKCCGGPGGPRYASSPEISANVQIDGTA